MLAACGRDETRLESSINPKPENASSLGSATLVQSPLRDDLLDELVLLVHPIIVGSGKRLFVDEGTQKTLELVNAQTFNTGVISLTYQVH